MATVTPGKTFIANEKVTLAKLNQLGQPTVTLDTGEVGLDALDPSAVRQLVPNVNRNLLINGNFDVWQRGGYTNLVGVPTYLGATANKEYGPDRWLLGTPSNTNKRQVYRGAFTVGQQIVPNEPTYYLRWSELVAETGDYRPILQQPIEDVRTVAGKDVVVTWWMKGNYNGNITCRLLQYFGTPSMGPAAYSPRTITANSGGTATLSSANDWAKFTAKFSVPNLVGYGIEGDDNYLSLQFLLPDNATFLIDFAQVQLEEGTEATQYETLSYLQEYLRCQRYFELHGGIAGTSVADVMPCYYFSTRKRTAPTLALISGYAGTMTAANFSTILDVGYYQDTENSVMSAFFMACDAEF